MKKIAILLFVLSFLGCTYQGEKLSTYVDNPKTILDDPLSVNYQKSLDDLESMYMNKKITYAEYISRKQDIEDNYARNVKKRQDIIENTVPR